MSSSEEPVIIETEEETPILPKKPPQVSDEEVKQFRKKLQEILRKEKRWAKQQLYQALIRKAEAEEMLRVNKNKEKRLNDYEQCLKDYNQKLKEKNAELKTRSLLLKEIEEDLAIRASQIEQFENKIMNKH